MKIKANIISQPLIVTKISKLQNSQSNFGSLFQRIDFKGKIDNSQYYTQIDKSMVNYSVWKEIIDLGNGTVLTNLKIKNARTGLVDADSEPEILNSGANTFKSLFE
jgi:hypothetical protein